MHRGRFVSWQLLSQIQQQNVGEQQTKRIHTDAISVHVVYFGSLYSLTWFFLFVSLLFRVR